MKNAQTIAMEIHGLLPKDACPEKTEGYEGFYHMTEFNGNVEQAVMRYIIRNFDPVTFAEKQEKLRQAVAQINETYGEGTAEVKIEESYRNMREKIEPHMAIVEAAQQAMRDAGVTPRVVPIRGGKYLRAAKIGRAIMDADIFISLTHAKGHPAAGFGGALKNIGMGCGSRAGKEEMHSSGKPVVDQDKCIGCGKCIENCAHNGPHIENGKCTILKFKCTGCARCISVCPMHAIHPDFGIANEVLNCKIAEYAKAVVDGRPSFHIALALDVSPSCDCEAFNDVAMVPNVGMFASFDPVALDTACADKINAQPANPNSVIAHAHDHPHDHFAAAHPDTDWRAAVEHGEAIGLGTTHYELIEV